VRVSEDVLAYAEGAKNELLESLLRDIVGICLEYEEVEHVWAKVEKEYLAYDFKAVGVEIEATR
jgi:dihydroneopterin aldolase